MLGVCTYANNWKTFVVFSDSKWLLKWKKFLKLGKDACLLAFKTTLEITCTRKYLLFYLEIENLPDVGQLIVAYIKLLEVLRILKEGIKIKNIMWILLQNPRENERNYKTLIDTCRPRRWVISLFSTDKYLNSGNFSRIPVSRELSWLPARLSHDSLACLLKPDKNRKRNTYNMSFDRSTKSICT